MRHTWINSAIALIMLMVVAFIGLARHDAVLAAQDPNTKVESYLQDKFSSEGNADFIIQFAEQADLSAAYAMDWDARGEYVYNTLRQTAEQSQAEAKAMLDAEGLKYQTFINGNELYVWSGTYTNAIALAALPEISQIRATRNYSLDPFEVDPVFKGLTWAGDYLSKNALTTVGATTQATIDWGLTDTKADQFWTTFGVKGDGIVVANIDTGVQWNHPALVNQFKCAGQPANSSCWDDPSNVCGAGGACDNNGHGTHTMGTMVAADNPGLSYIAGMAPNAQWIACKGCEMLSAQNQCSDFALNSCADWILAPGGSSANRPQVVNNSWGGGGGDTWYQGKVQAWVAAGIFPAFSAGNSGSSCSTLGSPGDYQESFGTAAHDSSRNIAVFSSRGPSVFGHTPYTKPNISAPGVYICSTVPTNSWSCGYSGTSMASPHSAGAVALLWSCNPSLKGQVDATFQLLQNNADSAPAGNCSAPPDGQGNNTYGYGYLDVLAAGNLTCGGTQTGTINGYVKDQYNNPLLGAKVTATPSALGSTIEAYTDPTGFYTMNVPVGTYTLAASKNNYATQTFTNIIVVANTTTQQDFQLTSLTTWIQIAMPASCPDWTRFDGEYYPATGLVYFLGGRSGANDSTTVGDIYSFNPTSKTCADTGDNMPTGISNYSISLVNNGAADVLCTFGGRDATGTQIAGVQCYNPVTHSASIVTNMPAAWSGFGPYTQVVVNNKVYIFGGFRSSSSPYMLARTDMYDPVANSFTQMGNLNLARSYIMAAVIDGKIYAFGGDTYDGSNLAAVTKAEVLNPADPVPQQWNDAAVADLPAASGEGRAFGFNSNTGYYLAGKIILAGGGQWPAATNEVISYDVSSNTYNTSFVDLNVLRRDHAAFFVPGNPGAMWVFGGWSGADTPPYAPPEYYLVFGAKFSYLPIIKR
jgi:subtilisin family serine protease